MILWLAGVGKLSNESVCQSLPHQHSCNSGVAKIAETAKSLFGVRAKSILSQDAAFGSRRWASSQALISLRL